MDSQFHKLNTCNIDFEKDDSQVKKNKVRLPSMQIVVVHFILKKLKIKLN